MCRLLVHVRGTGGGGFFLKLFVAVLAAFLLLLFFFCQFSQFATLLFLWGNLFGSIKNAAKYRTSHKYDNTSDLKKKVPIRVLGAGVAFSGLFADWI